MTFLEQEPVEIPTKRALRRVRPWHTLACLTCLAGLAGVSACFSGSGEGLPEVAPLEGTPQPQAPDGEADSGGRQSPGSPPPTAMPAPTPTRPTDPAPTAGTGGGPNPDPNQPAPAPPPVLVEPVTDEQYYIRNLRDQELRVLARTLRGDAPVELLADRVPSRSEVHIYHAVEGSGGHAHPSNMFGSLRVTAGDEVVYEGVLDSDWQREAHGLVLTIPAEPVRDPPEPEPGPEPGQVDYSCQQASDCEIKNVGNCCGYYPRCVNQQSEPPPVQCGDGLVGVCGFPEITHCECVQNTCRSMQGSQEV